MSLNVQFSLNVEGEAGRLKAAEILQQRQQEKANRTAQREILHAKSIGTSKKEVNQERQRTVS
jgi:hypothetical protein